MSNEIADLIGELELKLNTPAGPGLTIHNNKYYECYNGIRQEEIRNPRLVEEALSYYLDIVLQDFQIWYNHIVNDPDFQNNALGTGYLYIGVGSLWLIILTILYFLNSGLLLSNILLNNITVGSVDIPDGLSGANAVLQIRLVIHQFFVLFNNTLLPRAQAMNNQNQLNYILNYLNNFRGFTYMLQSRLQDEISVKTSGGELKQIRTDRIERNLFGVPQVDIPNSGADEGGRRKKRKYVKSKKRRSRRK
jgi:hypothetical protein